MVLEGSALEFYAGHVRDCETYYDAVDALEEKYFSNEQRARMLQRWQTIRYKNCAKIAKRRFVGSVHLLKL
jgi:putative IMPACT (imprinted ancient) family translation regulator